MQQKYIQYMYMTVSATCDVWFYSQERMLWVERVLAVVGLLREASVTLACPYHCGSSVIGPFVLGLFTGLSIGLLCTAYLVFSRLPLHPVHFSQPPAATEVSEVPRRRSRLAGYLHE